jgi:glycosyltransferase involved in cell wall biosynthesis
MKILMTSHYTLPHRGGIEVIIEKLSAALVQQGHEVKIVSSKIEGINQPFLARREILGVKYIDPLMRLGVHYPLFSPQLFRILYQAVRWADIVHVQGMLYQNSLLALCMARRLNRPAVLTEHAAFVPYKRSFFNAIQQVAVNTIGKISLSSSDAITVHDSIVQQILAETLQVPSDKIIQFPLGVDTDIFHPVSRQAKQRLRRELAWDDRPKVLFIGNFVARKRIDLLIDALSEKFDIVLCGEGYHQFRVPKQVLVYPPMGHEQLARIYQAADLFVVPSSVETFSIVAYEAMASGLPVVMTHDLSHLTIAKSELVTFVAAEISALRYTIHSLLEDEDKRERIGQASVEWVKKNFSWGISISQHLAAYHKLLVENTTD